ncbi:hypothetical protein GCM10023210_35860 [Chryseobacterium ginsengisoli]|uniref:Anti-sigma factor n=1 Tax=Chryseobacterium ginsengisoli TaxID=363853 RepID=A0ABP9MMU2_9FLAO
MNTTKNNIEYQIKKQIEEREIAPSRDLWTEIQAQTPISSSKTKVNWFLVAACLILTFSLGAVLFFNKENKPDLKSKIAVENKNPEIQENKPAEIKSPEVIEQDQKESVAIQNISHDNKAQTSNSKVAVQEKPLPLTKENAPEIISNISKIEPEKVIAQSDSAKIPARKKKYVDPSTLLFSVEHKDVIEKTKGVTNVATIDLNGK